MDTTALPRDPTATRLLLSVIDALEANFDLKFWPAPEQHASWAAMHPNGILFFVRLGLDRYEIVLSWRDRSHALRQRCWVTAETVVELVRRILVGTPS